MAASQDYASNLVLSRLTYGPETTSRANLQKLGLSGWLKAELRRAKPETHPFLTGSTLFLSNQLSLSQVKNHPNFRRQPQRISQEVAALTTLRRLYSVNQVRESLVEFISDYVPVPLYSPADWARMDYDQTIRGGISGTYPDLLSALAFHPAMLFYLNGQTNTATSPNENFGRELLELFTVTPAAKYSEKDVVASARLFSGISFSLLDYKTRAVPSDHYFGEIRVMGFRHSNAKTEDSETILNRARQLIRHLALQPETAKAFSARMAKRFLSDKPPADVLRAMEAKYLATGGSIFETLRTLAEHPRFISTPPSKVKRPAEHFSSTVRALALDLAAQYQDLTSETSIPSDALNQLLAVLNRQGHLPYDWETPDGFPDTSAAWSTFGGQIQRWNFSSILSQGGYQRFFQQADLVQRFGNYSSLQELVSLVSTSLLAQPLLATDQAEIVKLLETNKGNNPLDAAAKKRQIGMALALVMATEEWNTR